MLKKLRLKFILISMISVFLVLAASITAINVSNYVFIEKESKTTLGEVIQFGGGDQGHPQFKSAPPDGQPPEGEPPEGKPNEGGHDGDRGYRDSSYFVTIFDGSGNIQSINYNHVFDISEDTIKDLSLKVYNNELTGRKYETFRFKKETKDDGLTYVAFVDIKIELEEANKFLLISSLISLGAYIVLAGLIVVASKIAFKPNEDAYRKQKKFITNASHELKTPLTIISADLDLLEMDNGKSEWSDSIRSQVERLTKMTKQLVDLSRLEEDDQMNYPFEEFSLNEVCNEVISSFEQKFKKEGIMFLHTIPDDLKFFGSKYLIEDLVYIFLDNSSKYTGGENKESVFKVSKTSKGKVELLFSNTLDKLDEVDEKQIMERFYRSPSNKKDGSGVGLSIAQEIINLHKGKIKIEKSENMLTFIVTL